MYELGTTKKTTSNVALAKELQLAKALSLITQWRANKQSRSETIPVAIWQRINELLVYYPAKTLASLFQFTTAKIEEKCLG